MDFWESLMNVLLFKRGLSYLFVISCNFLTTLGEESREAPEQLAWGLDFPEATRAGP